MRRLQGIYLVIDPSAEHVLDQLSKALLGGIDLIQVWNHWPADFSIHQKTALIHQIKQLAGIHNVPVLMHDDWKLCVELELDGVHFDKLPVDWPDAKEYTRDKITGLTVGNDPHTIELAEKEGFSYLSFCAMFPSTSAGNCEIVTPESVRKAREITSRPLFLSGGIKPENLELLRGLDFQGVAIISGIMSSNDPETAVKSYRNRLNKIQKIPTA
ncbi:thiamine phosphate synthase [Marinoscillum sp.]|uniref:thiamine phosphate synthase n=1 Tax=Marinoscillum sp. TaxID=2024838 RepID=UPI003BACAAD0